MSKVTWINHKEIKFSNIEKLLEKSIRNNHLTNYGPLVKSLESFFKNKFNIQDDKTVIATCNGAAAMHALVSGIELYHSRNNNMRYATQDFTFPCSKQGPLTNSVIVDVDQDVALDLNLINPEDIDGIIVTNLFGHVSNLSKYVEWSEKYNKILLFDNATVTMTEYAGTNSLNYGTGSIVSLHHTKPLGYGEGGLIIVNKKYEDAIRKCINFGFSLTTEKLLWDSRGSNYKMSEIAAAFILDYLTIFDNIVEKHKKLYQLFLQQIHDIPGITPFPNYSSNTPFVNCFPILFDKEITTIHLYQLEILGITARKYYSPLEDKERSSNFFRRILCLPCHMDMDEDTLLDYIKQITSLS